MALTGVQAEEGEILIGGALCLTGVQAPLDEPGLKGAQVAIKALNDAGNLLGKKVRFVNLDGKSDPVTVGNAAVQLIDQGAQFIVAPCDFDFGGPASREAQKAGLVGISTCASSPLYSSWSLGDKQFTLSMWNTTMGAAAADYAFKERGWKTAYVVTDQFIDYTKSLSRYFITSFSPAAFYLKETFVILGMLVIGGPMTVTGAVVGTVVVTLSFEGLRAMENQINMAQVLPNPVVGLTEVVLAVAMILVLILRPGGITGRREVGQWVLRWRESGESGRER